MTNQVTSIGNNGISTPFRPSVKAEGEVSKTNGGNIQVKAPEQMLLQQYREQGVELELSGTFSKFTEEELEEMKKSDAAQSMAEMYQEQLEAAKKSAEAAGEGFEDMGKALEIARRMMHGDLVPSSDEKFLMDYNKDIYMSAKNMQAMAQNEHKKKYDSVLDEEEDESEGNSVREEGGDLVIDASKLNLCTKPTENGMVKA